MNKIGTKIIDTERCILRRIVPDDYQMMYENWAKYEEVCRYFPFNPVTDMEIYKEKVHKWADNYESDTYFHWVIEWKENHDFLSIQLPNENMYQIHNYLPIYVPFLYIFPYPLRD